MKADRRDARASDKSSGTGLIWITVAAFVALGFTFWVQSESMAQRNWPELKPVDYVEGMSAPMSAPVSAAKMPERFFNGNSAADPFDRTVDESQWALAQAMKPTPANGFAQEQTNSPPAADQYGGYPWPNPVNNAPESGNVRVVQSASQQAMETMVGGAVSQFKTSANGVVAQSRDAVSQRVNQAKGTVANQAQQIVNRIPEPITQILRPEMNDGRIRLPQVNVPAVKQAIQNRLPEQIAQLPNLQDAAAGLQTLSPIGGSAVHAVQSRVREVVDGAASKAQSMAQGMVPGAVQNAMPQTIKVRDLSGGTLKLPNVSIPKPMEAGLAVREFVGGSGSRSAIPKITLPNAAAPPSSSLTERSFAATNVPQMNSPAIPTPNGPAANYAQSAVQDLRSQAQQQLAAPKIHIPSPPAISSTPIQSELPASHGMAANYGLPAVQSPTSVQPKLDLSKVNLPDLALPSVQAPTVSLPPIQTQNTVASATPQYHQQQIAAPANAAVQVPQVASKPSASNWQMPEFSQPQTSTAQQPQLTAPQLPPSSPVAAPQLSQPQVQVPQFQAPQYQTPQYQTPQPSINSSPQIPQVQTPTLTAPQFETPSLELPQLQTPQIQAPQVQSPTLTAPQIQASVPTQTQQVQAPTIPSQNATAPAWQLPNVPEIQTPNLDLPQIQTQPSTTNLNSPLGQTQGIQPTLPQTRLALNPIATRETPKLPEFNAPKLLGTQDTTAVSNRTAKSPTATSQMPAIQNQVPQQQTPAITPSVQPVVQPSQLAAVHQSPGVQQPVVQQKAPSSTVATSSDDRASGWGGAASGTQSGFVIPDEPIATPPANDFVAQQPQIPAYQPVAPTHEFKPAPSQQAPSQQSPTQQLAQAPQSPPALQLPSTTGATQVASAGGSRGDLVEATRVLAMVGNQPILAGDVLGQVNQLLEQYEGKAPKEELEQQRQVLVQQALPQLVDNKLIFLDFMRDIPIDKLPDLEKRVFDVFAESELPKLIEKSGVSSAKDLDAKLRQFGSSIEKQRRLFMEKAVAQQQIQSKISFRREVKHDELLQFYEDNINDYRVEARAKFEHLMVRFDRFDGLDVNGNYDASIAENQARAAMAEMGNQVLGGAPMTEVAKRSSHGPFAEKGGAHDWTVKGALASDTMDTALFRLPVGKMSQIIEDEQGLHIMRVVEREPAGAIPFGEVQNKIAETIKQRRFQKGVKAYLAKLRDTTHVRTVYDDGENGGMLMATPNDPVVR